MASVAGSPRFKPVVFACLSPRRVAPADLPSSPSQPHDPGVGPVQAALYRCLFFTCGFPLPPCAPPLPLWDRPLNVWHMRCHCVFTCILVNRISSGLETLLYFLSFSLCPYCCCVCMVCCSSGLYQFDIKKTKATRWKLHFSAVLSGADLLRFQDPSKCYQF